MADKGHIDDSSGMFFQTLPTDGPTVHAVNLCCRFELHISPRLPKASLSLQEDGDRPGDNYNGTNKYDALVKACGILDLILDLPSFEAELGEESASSRQTLPLMR